MPRAELTLIANVALDRVNRGPWTCGGCPAFAPYAFAHLHACGVINAACADEDLAAFHASCVDGSVAFRFTRAEATTRFDLNYSGEFGETRSMVVHTIGHAWSEVDIDRLEIDTEWVHLAPLLRSDFSAGIVALLSARGHRISYDGQGLVRVPQLGELTLDARYDPELIRHLTVLKLSEDETAVLAAERGREAALATLSAIPELLLTLGFHGAEIRSAGTVSHVTPDRVITEVQTTGAGDAFMIAYLIARHRGLAPTGAAAVGANIAAGMLAERKGSR
ncbi:MAG TPA: PfkB family carbohydrate kinase [Solirubrobacteraceae bacterium]|nr:PfkB family carbohydrate kinase [Solirubrobacteraceae bacterium]